MPSPRRILPGDEPCALHGVDASRRIEAAALALHAPHVLMQRAGLAAARLALAVAPHARSVWVACGPGNNGGDGLVAAMHLHHAGLRVQVSLIGDAQRLPDDARDALEHALQAGVRVSEALPSDDDAQLVIDALLGLGASRAPQGPIAAAIERTNRSRAVVVAADLPSGLGADTGQPLGAEAVRASHTLSLLTLKPGLFTGTGRDHCGEVWLDTLGCADSALAATARLAASGDLRRLLAPRRHASHKGSYGDAAVVGGAAGMTGAALLAARGALAAGAGRVFTCLLDPAAPAFDPTRPEAMFRPRWWQSAPAELQRCTVACGCGGGHAVREALPALLSRCTRLVLDADALNAVAADPALRRQLEARAPRGQHTVLTPHPLEAARLLQADAATVQADRLHHAAELARRHSCVVLLKGSGSVIAAPGGELVVNPTGNALLAAGGSGDVLAGWTAGLWAQSADAAGGAMQAAVAAAWLHGYAADLELARAPASLAMRAGSLSEAMRSAAAALGSVGRR